MEIESKHKIVEYDRYCKSCVHFDDEPFTDPCNECLNTPTNIDSHRPVYWSESNETKQS